MSQTITTETPAEAKHDAPKKKGYVPRTDWPVMPCPKFLEGKKVLIADTETNALLKAVSKFHCFQLGDAFGTDAVLYGPVLCDDTLEAAKARIREADYVVFHNGLGYDYWVIEKFFPGLLPREKVLDTLVLARMAYIDERDHTLRAWGIRIGNLKDNYKGDYQTFDEEFATYSRQDIVVGRELLRRVWHVMDWGRGKDDARLYAWEIEHAFQFSMAEQEQHGVRIDRKKAEELHMALAEEQAAAKAALLARYLPLEKSKTIVPKRDNKTRGYAAGVPFTKTWEQEINLNSRQQIVAALKRDGWVPTKFSKPSKNFPSGQPVLDEETLLGIGGDGPDLLRQYFRVTKLLSQVVGSGQKSQGLLQLIQPDDRVYGRINTLGAITWRCTHSKPNLANVDKDHRVRELYIATPGMVLVGCDGKEIQARWLAHYLTPYDGGTYATKLIAGDKKLGTDGHSMNMKALQPWGLPRDTTTDKTPRDGAKTCQYAKVFGCYQPRMFLTVNQARIDCGHGVLPFILSMTDKEEVARVFEAAPEVEKVARRAWTRGERALDLKKVIGGGALTALGKAMPGLDDLLGAVQGQGAARGYMVGIGGARVPVAAKHAALVSLLQHAEAVAMKIALTIVEFEEAPKRGWKFGSDYAWVTNVHDEAQTECRPEIAEEFGQTFSAAIAEAGRRLGTRCDLGGEHKIGPNWAVTH